LAHDWWGMTCGFNVYVFMFWVTLDDLLVGYIGMRIFKKEKKKKKKKKKKEVDH
jgi:polyferredoxin